MLCRVCYVGDRLLTKKTDYQCNSTVGGDLYKLYCNDDQNTTGKTDCNYFNRGPVGPRPGIPGLASGVFYSK